jgi:hypothetical protein
MQFIVDVIPRFVPQRLFSLSLPRRSGFQHRYLGEILAPASTIEAQFSAKPRLGRPVPIPVSGDLIERNLVPLAIVYFWQIFRKFQKKPKSLGYFFSQEKLGIIFAKNVDWATFWVIFVQTYFVTLANSSFDGSACFLIANT